MPFCPSCGAGTSGVTCEKCGAAVESQINDLERLVEEPPEAPSGQASEPVDIRGFVARSFREAPAILKAGGIPLLVLLVIEAAADALTTVQQPNNPYAISPVGIIAGILTGFVVTRACSALVFGRPMGFVRYVVYLLFSTLLAMVQLFASVALVVPGLIVAGRLMPSAALWSIGKGGIATSWQLTRKRFWPSASIYLIALATYLVAAYACVAVALVPRTWLALFCVSLLTYPIAIFGSAIFTVLQFHWAAYLVEESAGN